MAFELRSSAFKDGQPIPVRYTSDGDNVSPPLEWSGAPAGTATFALICDDPDAPREVPFVHWILYGLPGDAVSLAENLSGDEIAKRLGIAGRNDFGGVGYGGPSPPKGHGVHHYHFRLYALGARLQLDPWLTKQELLQAMAVNVLGATDLIGTYERGRAAAPKPKPVSHPEPPHGAHGHAPEPEALGGI